MTFEIFVAFALLIGALVIFAIDRFPVDSVAFGIMVMILVLGPILDVAPLEAISGVSNPATITVMAMFILSGGIYRTGLINLLAKKMIRVAGKGELRQLTAIMAVSAPISAFINLKSDAPLASTAARYSAASDSGSRSENARASS